MCTSLHDDKNNQYNISVAYFQGTTVERYKFHLYIFYLVLG